MVHMPETNFATPFSMFFSLTDGHCDHQGSVKRHLSQMAGMYVDGKAHDALLMQEDALVYEFYQLNSPSVPSALLFGTSIVYPGKVGSEYFMTKGHFHAVIDTPEIYYCLRGKGYLVMQTREGKSLIEFLKPGVAVYVPGHFAHRSVNTGQRPLVTFFTYPANAGHDYETIERTGFRKLIVEKNMIPTVIDNPQWSNVL